MALSIWCLGCVASFLPESPQVEGEGVSGNWEANNGSLDDDDDDDESLMMMTKSDACEKTLKLRMNALWCF